MTEINRSPLPVRAQERIQVIDVLRGFAILGILLFNMRSFSGQAFPASSWSGPLDKAIVILLDFLVQAKFYSLFSFLFGWGMAVQMRRIDTKKKRFLPVYLRRLIILFIFGALHKIMLWAGDILLMYAILGIIMLLIFRRLPPKALLAAALLFLIFAILLTLPGVTMNNTREWCRNVTSCISTDRALSESLYTTGTYWEVTQLRFQTFRNGFSWFPCYMGNVIAMMLLGLYAGKRRLFENFDIHKNLFRQIMWVGLIVGVVLNGYFAYISAYPFSSQYYSLARIGSRTFGAPALTLFYVTGITLLYQREKWRKRLSPLAHVGRMALTNYISHSIFLPLVFYGYGLGFYGLTDPTFGLIFTLVIYRTQIQISQWWFERYQFGPLEWLWRTLTYSMKLPFSIEDTYDSLKKFSFKNRKQWTIILSIIAVLVIGGGIIFGIQYVNRSTEHVPDEQLTSEATDQAVEETEESIDDELPTPFTEAIDLPSQDSPLIDPASLDPQRLENIFDPTSAFNFIEVLSGDQYQGRYAGTSASHAAGDYIAEQFRRFDLVPVGAEGSYFQSFPIQSLVLDSKPFLKITSPDGTIDQDYQIHKDYFPVLGAYAGPGSAEGKAVWAVNCSQSDFHEIDVVGRIVVCRLSDLQDQVRLAAENNAAGLLLLTDKTTQSPDFRDPLLEAWIPDPIPVFQIYTSAAVDLLKDSEISLADLSILYEPVDLETSVQMNVAAQTSCGQGDCEGRNLLGLVAGYDPDKNDQVIILGANYDSLGMAPDGTIWPGANDNASGVSILLEIARSWKEEGFKPGVTVLFAAWDAQQQEFLGLDHFLQDPIYPLENTIAVIHLDQVGAGGDILKINGSGASEQIIAASAGIGIEAIAKVELSGAANLLTQAEMPFSIISWEGADLFSGKPADRADAIQLERLEGAGKIIELVVFQLSEVPATINDLLLHRCEAIIKGDLTAFLSTGTLSQVDKDKIWFEDVISLEPVSCEMLTSGIQQTGSTARADISIQLDIPADAEAEEEEETSSVIIRMPALFQFNQNEWLWAGPQLVEGETASAGRANFTVHFPLDSDEELEGLAQAAADEYARISKLLSLSSELQGRLYVYPGANLLKADTRPSQAAYMDTWVGPNTLKFSDNPLDDRATLLDTITHLLLENHSIPRDSFPWLWEGLPLILENHTDQILQQADKLGELQGQLSESEISFQAETSWAAVVYIQQTNGYAGLGRMIETLGSACLEYNCETAQGSDLALIEALQLDQASFDNAWTEYWQIRLDDVQMLLDNVLVQRTEAVLSGDESAFLETVDPQIPNLMVEEMSWFKELSHTPPEAFRLTANPIAILDGGNILADVRVLYTLVDVPSPLGRANFSYEILFTPSEDGLLWAGPIFQSVWGNNVRIRYPEGLEDAAITLLEDAEQIYSRVVDDLRLSRSHRLTINLYEDKNPYRASIALGFPAPDWAPGWTAPGQSIKLLLNNDLEDENFHRALELQLTRQLLMQIGVQNDWMLTGGSCYLLSDTESGLCREKAEASFISLMYTINKGQEFDLSNYPDLYSLEEREYSIALAQSWDSISYFSATYGHQALIDLLLSQPAQSDLDIAMQTAINRSTQDFFADWKESFMQGHIPEKALEISLEFNVNEALEHIDHLTSPELAGRQAGSPGSDLAADYIAAQFSKSGLIVEQQHFPVSYQEYLEVPEFKINFSGDNSMLIYREDFLVLQQTVNSELLIGELIWVADDDYTEMDLDGKIAVRKPTLPIEDEIANAVAHGAGALILVNDKNRDQELMARFPFSPSTSENEIPVIELTRNGFKRFLEILDLNQAILYHALPATLLNAEAQILISVSEPMISETSNVIGYLPGSNPNLEDELIIIGAHYDHVGDELGTSFSGSNDNASGIAALLEMTRLLQEEDYHPGRSLLFIAWGAQEPGELGSRYYISNPVYPLENTAAVLQMDGIGGGDGFFLDAIGDRGGDGLLLFSILRASELLDTRITITGLLGAALPDPANRYSPAALFDSPHMTITSDDVPFRAKEIPTLLLRWQDVSENNLPDTHVDPISPHRLENSSRTILATLLMLAR